MNYSLFKTIAIIIKIFPLKLWANKILSPFSFRQYNASMTAKQIETSAKLFAHIMHKLLLFLLQLHVFPG